MPAAGGAASWMKPAKLSDDFGARSGAIGSLASANGARATTTETGSACATLVPDATVGVSPMSMARSLSSGHLNLSQPTGSWANAGPAIAQAARAMSAYLTVVPI